MMVVKLLLTGNLGVRHGFANTDVILLSIVNESP